ncbi:toxin-antitoxin system HicB family antitoxin [Sulfuritortus calidifontis]|uniref:toxin-antitoxin system HicB family antitoxin n=1 Tax=Sulfuritortus calidifontis TaxID=1914471 RepID=UPI0022B2961A|nr:toxin-antitoxin system HicB family antitoxin [Sulfuritortus calidifontis]
MAQPADRLRPETGGKGSWREDCRGSTPDAKGCVKTSPAASGRFVTRLPKSVHAKLAERAKAEGVSLNALVLAFIAEGLGRKDAHV